MGQGMSDNPFRKSISPEEIPALIYSENTKIGALLHKSLTMIGFTQIKVVSDEVSALEAMSSFAPPRVVIMFANMKDAHDLSIAKKINKKRASTNRRTPKILAMMNPSLDEIVKAKAEGFWDVLPLPATPKILAGRLETVMTRLD